MGAYGPTAISLSGIPRMSRPKIERATVLTATTTRAMPETTIIEGGCIGRACLPFSPWAWPLGGQLQRRNEMSAAADYVRFYVTVHTKGEAKLTAATEKTLPKGSGEGLVKWYRPLAVGLSALFVAYGLFVLALLVSQPAFGPPGSDREIYVGAAQRWLGGGPYFYPEQLAGRYELATGHVLYPPPALLAFAVLSFLPAILWWLIPLAIVGAVIAWHRPAPWAWPLIAACLGFQWSVMLAYTGNPTIWLAAAVALGTLWHPVYVFVLIKPTLLPFALLGAVRARRIARPMDVHPLGVRQGVDSEERPREPFGVHAWSVQPDLAWWIAAAIGLAVSIPFWGMWVDWFHAVTNAYGWRVGPLYSLGDVPWLLAPVIAAYASSHESISTPAP
jgi:hypothetical protein